MLADDFIYDGLRLSDLGLTFCSFNGGGIDTTTAGSEITFNTVPSMGGTRNLLTDTKYDTCLELTFCVCKSTCDDNDAVVSVDTFRMLMRWLNRRSFYEARFTNVNGEGIDISFFASFNIKKVEMDGRLYGAEITMKTNAPFGFGNRIENTFQFGDAGETKTFYVDMDECGSVYPVMEITVLKDGTLTLENSAEQRVTTIRNCKAGEKIYMNYPIITSSLANRKIQKDFNWIFFRFARTYHNSTNSITASLPCTIKTSYMSVIKFSV